MRDASPKTAVGTGHDVLPSHQVGKADDALGHELGMLDDIAGVTDDPRHERLAVREPHVAPDLPLVFVPRVGGLDRVAAGAHLQDRKLLNQDRLQLLALADGQFFTSEQGKALVQAIPVGGDGQRRVAIWLYGRLVDRQNFNTVLEAIRLQVEREAVLRALGLKVR